MVDIISNCFCSFDWVYINRYPTKVEPEKEPDQVRCSHLLIKHTESNKPISERTNKEITLSVHDALEEIKSWEGNIGSDDDFALAARQRSDCSSFKDGGDIGYISRGILEKPFEDECFALEVGEMSDVVETSLGFHLILRTA